MEDLKSLLQNILQQTPGYEQRSKDQVVLEAWPLCVGQLLSKHAKAIRLDRDGTLLVAAEHGAWSQQLRFLEPQILQKLNRHLSEGRPQGTPPHPPICRLRIVPSRG